MKIQCKVCIESPIVDIPDIETVNDNDEILCPDCGKWLATAHIEEWNNRALHYQWSTEDTTYKTEDGKIIKNYPIKIIN